MVVGRVVFHHNSLDHRTTRETDRNHHSRRGERRRDEPETDGSLQCGRKATRGDAALDNTIHDDLAGFSWNLRWIFRVNGDKADP